MAGRDESQQSAGGEETAAGPMAEHHRMEAEGGGVVEGTSGAVLRNGPVKPKRQRTRTPFLIGQG